MTSVGMSWATVITWDQSKLSSMAMNIESGSGSKASDGIEVTAVSTGEFVRFCYGGAIEIGNGEGSGGGYLTFTSSVGNIAQIDINHSGAGEWSNANGDWISPYYENFEGGIFRWSGTPAASITLTGDAPRHIENITSIEFTIEDGGGSTPAGLQVTELQVLGSWEDNPTMLSISDMPGFVAITEAEAIAWDAAPAGKVDLIFAFEDNAATALSFKNGVYQAAQAHNITYEDLYAWYSNGDKIFYTGGGSTPTGLQVIELQVPSSWEGDNTLVTVSDLPGFVVFTLEEAGTWAAPDGNVNLIYMSKNNEGVRATSFFDGVWGQEYVAGFTRSVVFGWASNGNRIFYTTDGSTPTPKPSWVLDGDEWDEGTKTLTVNSNPGTGAYASQSEIENLIISDAVTSIGQAAFGGCSNISYVACGNNIQTIGVGAFTMCGFTYIELPASVTTIGNSAFYSCSNLSSVTIGNNVASIGDHAFDACVSLTEITIPASVTTIGVDAFYNCTGMTDVYCYPNAADLTWNEDGCDDFKSGNATQCHVNADQLDAYQTKFNGVVRVTFVGDLPAPAPAGLQVTELQIPDSWQNDNTLVTISDLPGFVAVSLEEAKTWDAAPAGYANLIYAGQNDEGVTLTYFVDGVWGNDLPVGGFTRANIFEWASYGDRNFYTSGGSTPTPTPTPSGDANIFNYSYECDRSQYYPTKDNACNVYNFENEAAGQWKVEFLENYNRNNTAYANAEDLWSVLGNYYNSVPGYWEEEAFWSFVDEHPVPVFTLSQWDGSEYQFVSYGLVLAYANPSNAVEHAAVFRANGSFRYLTDNTHGVYDDFNITFDSDLTDGLQDLVPEPSVPTDQEIADAVIALINAIGTVEYTAECEGKITAAREAYDALTDAQKALVANYGVLLDAETAYAQLTPTPSGECGAQGDNLLWELNTSTGVLTITGSGAMYDWPYDTDLPWYDNRLQITSVVLPSGITSIGTKAFRGCQNLASINMTENYPAGLTAINQEAFCHTALTSVIIPKSVVTIGQDAFYQSQSITDVYCYADPNNLTWTDFWGDDFNQSPSKSTQCHVKDCYLDVYNSKWNTGTTSTDVNVTFVGDLPGECGGSTPVVPVADLSKDIEIDLRSQQLGGDGSTGGAKYLIIDSEDNYTYVDDAPAAYNAYFAFENFNGTQHGYTNLVMTAPVEAGKYLLTLGGCQYGNGAGNVKNAASEILVEIDQKTDACYNGNPAQNTVSMIFTVDAAQTITIDCGNWTPYIALKKMPEIPAFTDFTINFMSDSYTVAEGTLPAGTDIDGTPNTGQTAHGYQNVVATVPVKAGKYRLTLGTCQYGTGTGNVMSETNIELASFDQKTAACYHQDPANNIVSMIFDVDQDQTITIDCGNYTPYMKLEAVTSYAVEFALGDAEGTVPAAVDVTVGEGITMPVNKTMYKAGYTLTGWSDGVNTYPIGESFTPANDAVLTPVFTANEADLLNASTDVTVKWYFGGDNGAPVMHLEGSAGLLVAQATIGDKTVDVKLSIDATSGKFVPQPTTEWAQVRVGTIFTYPYKEGMTVDVHTYSGNVTYYVADGNVTCGTNDYYSFIEVTYPASAPTTAVVIGDPNDADQVTAFLTTYAGQMIDELIIDRPVLNNMYNTLCLPFDMNAAQIAASSLNGVEIREFTGASVEGTTLNLSVGDPVNAVVAGRPYFVKYSAASQLDNLHFEEVTINNALLDNMAVTFDGVTFKGTFTPFVMPNGLNFQGGYLFLGQNNQLFWPNTSNPLKPFRAYFYVDVESSTPGNAPKYRGMPARIVEGKNVATGVENAQSANQSTKVIVNGQLIIIKNDVRYNAQGQVVK